MNIQKTKQWSDYNYMGILEMAGYIQSIFHKHELMDLPKIPA